MGLMDQRSPNYSCLVRTKSTRPWPSQSGTKLRLGKPRHLPVPYDVRPSRRTPIPRFWSLGEDSRPWIDFGRLESSPETLTEQLEKLRPINRDMIIRQPSARVNFSSDPISRHPGKISVNHDIGLIFSLLCLLHLILIPRTVKDLKPA